MATAAARDRCAVPTTRFPMRSLLLAALLLTAAPAFAADDAPKPTTLTVTAEGHVDRAPDVAELSGGVVTQAPTAAAALAANAARMTSVVAAIRRAGIAEQGHPDERPQPRAAVSLRRWRGPGADRLSGDQHRRAQGPRARRRRAAGRCAGRRRREPDQRPGLPRRRRRGDARRRPHRGDGDRPRPRRAATRAPRGCTSRASARSSRAAPKLRGRGRS